MAAGAIGMTFDAIFWNTKLGELHVGNTCKIDIVTVPKLCGKLSEWVIRLSVFGATLPKGGADGDDGVMRRDIPFPLKGMKERLDGCSLTTSP